MVNHVRTRVVICPNPECRKEIKEPILFTVQGENYYACPHCFVELNAYACTQEEHIGATVEKYPQDSVLGKAESIQVRSHLDILAPNTRFRRP